MVYDGEDHSTADRCCVCLDGVVTLGLFLLVLLPGVIRKAYRSRRACGGGRCLWITDLLLDWLLRCVWLIYV